MKLLIINLIILNVNLAFGQISGLITYEKLGESIFNVSIINSSNKRIKIIEEYEVKKLCGSVEENKIAQIEFDSSDRIELYKSFNYTLGFNESTKYYYKNDKIERIDKFQNDVKYGSSYINIYENRPFVIKETRINDSTEQIISLFKIHKLKYFTEVYENDSLAYYIVEKSNEPKLNKIKSKILNYFLIDDKSKYVLEVHSSIDSGNEIITSYYYSDNILIAEIIQNNRNEVFEMEQYKINDHKIVRILSSEYSDKYFERIDYEYENGVLSSCIKYCYKDRDWVEAARYSYKLTFY